MLKVCSYNILLYTTHDSVSKCTVVALHMLTSSNGNLFRVTGHLCGEFTGHRWIPHTKGQWRGALMCSLICPWMNDWVNNREAGDLIRNRVHYDVTVMILGVIAMESQTPKAFNQHGDCWCCVWYISVAFPHPRGAYRFSGVVKICWDFIRIYFLFAHCSKFH